MKTPTLKISRQIPFPDNDICDIVLELVDIQVDPVRGLEISGPFLFSHLYKDLFSSFIWICSRLFHASVITALLLFCRKLCGFAFHVGNSVSHL